MRYRRTLMALLLVVASYLGTDTRAIDRSNAGADL